MSIEFSTPVSTTEIFIVVDFCSKVKKNRKIVQFENDWIRDPRTGPRTDSLWSVDPWIEYLKPSQSATCKKIANKISDDIFNICLFYRTNA